MKDEDCLSLMLGKLNPQMVWPIGVSFFILETFFKTIPYMVNTILYTKTVWIWGSVLAYHDRIQNFWGYRYVKQLLALL